MASQEAAAAIYPDTYKFGRNSKAHSNWETCYAIS